jgi:hypothetical protein
MVHQTRCRRKAADAALRTVAILRQVDGEMVTSTLDDPEAGHEDEVALKARIFKFKITMSFNV